MELLLLGLLAGCAAVAPPTAGPIIGIVGLPGSQSCDSVGGKLQDDGGYSCFTKVYAEWVHQAAARTVALPYDLSTRNATLFSKLMDSVNGVLFTGGNIDIGDAGAPEAVGVYMQTLRAVYNTAAAKFEAGVHFPVWGTCMGFQVLSILGAGGNSSVLVKGAFDSENINLPLVPTASAPGSRLLGSAPEDVYNILTTWNVTANLHTDGVRPATFETNVDLAAAFDLLAVGYDRKGAVFGAAMEHRRYPIYGVQFHPERPQYEWSPGHHFNRSRGAVTGMQWLASFFIEEAMRNSQTFPSEDTELLQWAAKHSTEGLPQRIQAGDRLSYLSIFYYVTEESQ